MLARPDVLTVVTGDVAVGLVTMRPSPWYDGPVALLEELYVQPHLRDRGIGGRVLAELMRIAVERGCAEMQINVDSVDIDTRRFYERHGLVNVEGDNQMLFYYRDM